MNVITELYNAVLTQVTSITSIKRFERYAGELESEHVKDYGLFYDSVYLEFDPVNWESLGNKRKHGICTFRLFVCSPAVHGSGSNEAPATRNAEQEHLERCDAIDYLMHTYAPDPDTGVGCISATEDNVNIKYPGLIVDILSYKVRLVKDSAKHSTIPLPAETEDVILTTIINPETMTKAKFVRDFSTIAGNSTAENAFLAAMQVRKITELYLYDLNTVIADSSGYPVLAAFVRKARTYGITTIYGFRSSETSLIGAVARSNESYNLAHPEAKINFSLEDEFWNYNLTGPDANAQPIGNKELQDLKYNSIWRLWIAQQIAIHNHAFSVGLKSDFYMGYVRDSVENTAEATISNLLVANTDRVLLHCYPTINIIGNNEGFKYIKSRLSILGKAALIQSKVIPVVVIFLAEVGNNDAAYASIVKYNKLANYAGKSGVRLDGWIEF